MTTTRTIVAPAAAEPSQRNVAADRASLLDHLSDMSALGGLLFAMSLTIADPDLRNQAGYMARRLRAHSAASLSIVDRFSAAETGEA
jgi:hypothetical protein